MNLKSLFCIKYIILYSSLMAQVGINTNSPHTSAALDINANSKPGGLLIPRVNLTSIYDISTIVDPVIGLLIYNLSDSGAAGEEVYANNLYKWDGTIWKKFSTRDELINNNTDLGYVVAFGKKTTIEDCDASTPGEAHFNLNVLSNPDLITSKGEFTAPKDGYYSFAAMANLKVKGNPSQAFTASPYIYADGLTTYVFKFRGSNVQDNPRTIVGVVYLTQGQKTNPFSWYRGGLSCTGTDTAGSKIKEQQVVWEYLGNPN